MEIKGTAVKTTLAFVKEKFPNRYNEWFDKLPESSQKILSEFIAPGQWYPMWESTIVPTRIAGELFYNDAVKGAREIGRYSADTALHGIYKIFIRIATPKFIISRTANVYSTYYRPSKVSKEIIAPNKHHLNIYEYDYDDNLMIYRMAGWIQRAFELTKRTNVQSEVSQFTKDGINVQRITASWD